MDKALEETRGAVPQHTENINKGIGILKRNQIEILVLSYNT